MSAEEISSLMKTMSSDDLFRFAMEQREQLNRMIKEDAKASKKASREIEKEEAKAREEDKRRLKRLRKLAKMEDVSDCDSESESESESEYESDSDVSIENSKQESKSKTPSNRKKVKKVRVCEDDKKRGPGRPRKERQPRKPSEYNLFVKDTMLHLAQEYPNMSAKDRMCKSAELWKIEKARRAMEKL